MDGGDSGHLDVHLAHPIKRMSYLVKRGTQIKQKLTRVTKKHQQKPRLRKSASNQEHWSYATQGEGEQTL